MGPDPQCVGLHGWRGALPPGLPQSPRAPRARVRRPSPNPREGGRGEPPAPGMEPHALAGPGRASPGTAPRSSPGKERGGPVAAPSPARDGRPGFLPGSASRLSRLQRVWTPPATPRPARPPYPDTAPLSSLLAPGTRTAPASDARFSARPSPPPSAGFQIEIPWLGPSGNSRRKPRPLLAEAPPRLAPLRIPPPGTPRARKPPREGHAPAAKATPPAPAAVGGGPSRGVRAAHGAQCLDAGVRSALGATLEIMTASARVRGVLSENPGLKCPLNFLKVLSSECFH